MERNLLSIIGNTPLIQLSKLFANDRGIQVFAKLELLNPGGSAKDRSAARIIDKAWEEGLIGPGSVIIESSSGNMAISLAAICSYLGMRFISVIDPKATQQNIRIMRAYGADIELVETADPETGEFLPARLQRVQQLVKRIPNSFWPNQYANTNNYLSHYEGTMREIVEELGHVDYIIGGVSTCGTMLGCAQYIKDHKLAAKVVAVDAAGSVIFGGVNGNRRFPGLGAGIIPTFGEKRFMDYAIKVADQDMVAGCRLLVSQESILAGPSSGAVIHALKSMEHELPDKSVCVVILHDRGERYMDTVYCDEWVKQQFHSS
ncbi:2,3-diaminopropionate biosynthesis protein SbnA [Paenibacillus sp. FSL H8-0548]|uniref:2,3-diaminopropionate biosynthesis protein SbnA n=1 Tax=Paenibacillus sp. FSL H8-0548 TaxID=1920422 RepID=UPI00096C6C64|nr:2,3-diaminopropionate biosynthesis protein SbnA [Paenibacillus sp. FSL H8-0548]OMF19290.1 2,3-diaminopropionate biosynthesis protein SbnA [Paenibacillus sp. FSL H8-0548]